ncbi:outer membrane protein assembly factor BamA [Planctomycetota bacterium]
MSREQQTGVARGVTIFLVFCLTLVAAMRSARSQGLMGDVREGKPIRVIRFEGTFRKSESFLREQIRSKVGDPFSGAVLDDDVKRLYLSGLVTGDVEAVAALKEGGVELTFVIVQPAIVREIEYAGLSTFTETELQKTPPGGLRLKRGEPYREHRARQDERLILQLLRGKGLFFAEIDREVTPLGAGGVRVVFKVREGPTVRVSEIRFVGNDHVEADQLLKYMKTQTTVLSFIRSGYFHRSDLDVDIGRIMTYYRGEGFLDVRAFVEDIRFSADRSRVKLTIRVAEGPRYRIRRIVVKGAKVIGPDKLRRDLELSEGEFFSGPDLERDKRTIERRYSDEGYVFARVRDSQPLVAGAHAVDVVLDVDEQTLVTVDQIRIEGNWKTRDDVIRRELSIVPGEPFRSADLDESRNRLGRRGLFKDMTVAFEPGTAEDRRDLVVRVEEADTGQILFGGGISSSAGFFGRIVYVQRNFDIAAVPTSWDDVFNGYFFAGAGQRLSIFLEPGRQQSRYRISFVEPYLLYRLLPIPLQLRTSFSYSDSVLARSFAEERLEAAVGLGYRVTRDSLVETSYRVTQTNVFDIDAFAPADVLRVAGRNVVSAGGLAYQLDRNLVDQNFLAYGGYGCRVVTEAAGSCFGGDFDLWRVEVDGNWQRTLFQWPRTSRHVFALRANAGTVGEYGRSSDVPIFERYFAGGPHSVRGFEVRSVGPQEDDEPVGGKVRVLGTAEYSFPIIPGFDETYAPRWRGDFLRGLMFLETGNVEPEIDDLSLDDFRVSAGFGLRIKIPVFPQPLALDFGFPLRQLDSDDREVFSFSIGVPF